MNTYNSTNGRALKVGHSHHFSGSRSVPDGNVEFLRDLAAQGGDPLRRTRTAGSVDPHLRENARRRRGKQNDPVRQSDGLFDAMGHQQRHHRPARHELGEFGPQPRGKFGIERNERLVEHQEIRLDGEGTRQGDAAGKTERKLARIVATMFRKFERGEQLREFRPASMRRQEPDIVFDRAPGQQPRLLEDDAKLAGRGQPNAAFEIAVQPDDDAQERGLAASGRADQGCDLARLERKRNLAEHVPPRTRCGAKKLVLDVHLKMA